MEDLAQESTLCDSERVLFWGAEFRGVPGGHEVVKRNVATGRDNVPGTILLFLPEGTQILLYHAVVERVAGREDVSRHRLLLC